MRRGIRRQCRVRASFVLADTEAGADAAALLVWTHARAREHDAEEEEEDDAKIAAPALMIRT